jgi:hypothetical protein
MFLGKAAVVLCLVYGLFFVAKMILLFFRGGRTRG